MENENRDLKEIGERTKVIKTSGRRTFLKMVGLSTAVLATFFGLFIL